MRDEGKAVQIELSLALAAAEKRCAAAGPGQTARRKALTMIAAEGLATPAFCYRCSPLVGVNGNTLELGLASLDAPGLAPLSSRLTAVAAVACTLGPALEARVSELCRERSMSLALALDELGNAMLMYTARCAALAVRRECRSQGLTSGDTLSPGGNGLPLAQQGAVLELAGGDRLGVWTTAQGMLSPIKSRSLVMGAGHGLAAQPLRRRCESCSSGETCRYRRKARHDGRLCPS